MIFIFLTGALGPMGPRGPGARGPWGPGALGPRYYYQGLGAHGPWGPGALGPRYYYQGPGAPGVCPTNYGRPCPFLYKNKGKPFMNRLIYESPTLRCEFPSMVLADMFKYNLSSMQPAYTN